MRLLLICGLAVAIPLLARAEPVLRAPDTAVPGDLVAASSGDGSPVLALQLVPATGAAGLAQSRILYLNRTGITVTPGASDSRTNRSSIVSQPSTIPAWEVSAATWSATRACVVDMFSRFAVTVTDKDPGAVPHIEAVIGGSPQDLGLPVYVGGVSPFSTSCGIIESSIVFVFTDVLPGDPQRICEVTAQEISHSYGLDHELLASDPMTYLSYSGKRRFQDQLVSCGESTPRPCGIGGTVCRQRQNSVALLNERVGAAGSSGAPHVAITSPPEGATVAARFTVSATASDDVGIVEAALYIDGELVATLPGPGPFAFPIAASMVAGAHTLDVEASDGQNRTSATIHVTVGGGGGDDDGGGLPGLGCSTVGGLEGTDLMIGLLLLLLSLLRRRYRGAAR